MLADMVAAAIVENRGLPWVAVVPSGTGRWATWLLRKGTKSCTTAGRRCYFSFVREQADGVLSSAAVPRAGLWPATPPLCRCAEYTADQLLRKRLAIYRVAPNIPACSFCEVGGDQLMCPNQTSTQPWRLVCTPSARASTEIRRNNKRQSEHSLYVRTTGARVCTEECDFRATGHQLGLGNANREVSSSFSCVPTRFSLMRFTSSLLMSPVTYTPSKQLASKF